MMAASNYGRKRFWCPREGKVDLSDRGYLLDPDSEWGHLLDLDIVPFESISNTRCLGLLGEPGMGKTTALKREYSKIREQLESTMDIALWFDLGAYQTDGRLCQSIFENPEFIAWQQGAHRLHLFLDSLDECLLQIKVVSKLLVEELPKYPTDRLFLRIACRTADWPSSMEEKLKGLWGEELTKVYELVPLRRRDVVETARGKGIDLDSFMQEVDRASAVPFAIKPVTLNFLLNTYKRSGCLPSTQLKLYEDGCRLLCKEVSKSRHEAGLTGSLDADQRLTVAARMAAMMIICNRYAISTRVSLGDIPEEDIEIRDLCGKKEGSDGGTFEVTEAVIREVAGTGLFSSRGPERMGWAHRTYAEFLAAYYLARHKLTLPQIMSLFLHPNDPDEKFVPQLHESLAWLSGMRADVFKETMRNEPEILLRSDVTTADLQEREALVEHLLEAFDEERILDTKIGSANRYAKLVHPGLAEQLRPYIANRGKRLTARCAAINIADACALKEIQEELLNIALNLEESLSIRVGAVCALWKIGDEPTKARLKPLAVASAEDDTDDELKGYTLLALWPSQLSAEELFCAIIPPKRDNFIGSYHRFLSSEIVKQLEPTNLPVALKWVESRGAFEDSLSPFEDLIDGILLSGWKHLEDPDIRASFAKAALSRLKHDHPILCKWVKSPFREEIAENNERRHRLIESMVELISDPNDEAVLPVVSQVPIVLSKDVPWMVDRLLQSELGIRQRVWARTIERAFDRHDREQLEIILSTCKSCPILAETFSWLTGPIELNSPRAERMKRDYQRMKDWEDRNQNRPLLDPPPSERVAQLLEQCESGDSSRWWMLIREMTLEPDSTHYVPAIEADIRSFPGWKGANLATQARLITLSKRYLQEQSPQVEEWLGQKVFHFPAAAGYRALYLLYKEAHDQIATLAPLVWGKWVPIILAYPNTSEIDDREIQCRLVEVGYQKVPSEVVRVLGLLIDQENRDHGDLFSLDKVKYCWDDRLKAALLGKVKNPSLKPEAMGALLGELIDHDVAGATTFAESCLIIPLPEGEDARAKAITSTRVLLTHARNGGWQAVWPAIQIEVDLGRLVISEVAVRSFHQEVVVQRLTEDQLASLYIWMARQFPHREDPELEGAGIVTPRRAIAEFRDSLLGALKSRGVPEACEAIRKIISELPEIDWLKWVLLEAQERARQGSWIPLCPKDILKLASSQQTRLVQNGEQLLDILLESLSRLEIKLQGETPSVIFLWDAHKKKYRPKEEESLSDFVKIHLDEDLRQRGIVVNREVVIRKGQGGSPGERTDIHVNAIRRDSNGNKYDVITAIIEVKGCWNPGLNQAMENQLLNRYLKDNQCRFGLYLIGWFNCLQWDGADSRKRQAPGLPSVEAQKQFDGKAAELSRDTVTIKALVLNTALR